MATDEAQAEDSSFAGMVSDDGRYVAFSSEAKNLVARPAPRSQLYVRDRQSGTTVRVSVSTSGRPTDRRSQLEGMSGDGRFVLFLSRSDYLVPHDTNNAFDLFVRDVVRGTTRRVSLGNGGRQANDDTWDGDMSGDGRWVAFTSSATNLVATRTPPDHSQVYLHNLVTGRTVLVSRNSQGKPAKDWMFNPSLSADGRFVSFESAAPDLGARADDTDAVKVFLRDRRTHKTRLVSLKPDGRAFGQASEASTISANGRVVAWLTGYYDRAGPIYTAYAWDWRTGKSEVVSIDSSGTASKGTSWGSLSLSGNGERVLFGSYSTLADDESPDDYFIDVFIRDRGEGTTTRVSRPGENPNWDAGSYAADITPNGEWVVFDSSHDTLVPGDTNGYIGEHDVFIQRLSPQG